MSLCFRWLGTAGLELTAQGRTLLIDPFVTRFPLGRVWFGRVSSARQAVQREIRHGEYILISHAHWDHLLDVPEILRLTGGVAYGSPNTCRLLAVSGIPDEQMRPIAAGDRLSLGPFSVTAFPAEHLTVLGRPIQQGPLPPDLRSPLRAREYRMDTYHSFAIEVNGYRLLDWASARAEEAPPADLLFVQPFHRASYYAELLPRVRPRWVVPIHWDRLIRPGYRLGQQRHSPRPDAPLWQVLNLSRFRKLVARYGAGARVLVARPFLAYDLGETIYTAETLNR